MKDFFKWFVKDKMYISTIIHIAFLILNLIFKKWAQSIIWVCLMVGYMVLSYIIYNMRRKRLKKEKDREEFFNKFIFGNKFIKFYNEQSYNNFWLEYKKYSTVAAYETQAPYHPDKVFNPFLNHFFGMSQEQAMGMGYIIIEYQPPISIYNNNNNIFER